MNAVRNLNSAKGWPVFRLYTAMLGTSRRQYSALCHSNITNACRMMRQALVEENPQMLKATNCYARS